MKNQQIQSDSMFVSVLIPTYDYTCYTLVHDLWQQFMDAGVQYEIIVVDDGGRDQVCAIANHKINDLPNCRFIRSKENVGRAYNCNNMVRMANGEWCLIIDSDAKVVRDNFVACYLNVLKSNPDIDIVNGDLINPAKLPSPEVSLRYFYEKHAEPNRVAAIRQECPFERFSTFNVLVRKSALEAIPFDADCTQYGYEDALMGIEMGKHGMRILHIDNPLLHLGFERNDVYLKKVETSLHTLKKLGSKMLPYTKIGRYVDVIKRLHIVLPVKVIFILSRPLLLKNILGEKPNLNIFSFYKLGYYLCLS